jgi:hypothetical protein
MDSGRPRQNHAGHAAICLFDGKHNQHRKNVTPISVDQPCESNGPFRNPFPPILSKEICCRVASQQHLPDAFHGFSSIRPAAGQARFAFRLLGTAAPTHRLPVPPGTAALVARFTTGIPP